MESSPSSSKRQPEKSPDPCTLPHSVLAATAHLIRATNRRVPCESIVLRSWKQQQQQQHQQQQQQQE
nr:unnamed protein product [Spirometra erinaceieuropaei]